MKFLSVDIETTGLDPNVHGVIQIGAVYADLYDPSFPIKTWQTWISPDGLVWTAYCMDLHKDWLARVVPRIVKKQYELAGEVYIHQNLDTALVSMKDWLTHMVGAESVVPAGKNFAGFDKLFLQKSSNCPKFKHRTLDPAAYFTEKGDIQPPDLRLCKERAKARGMEGVVSSVAHTALEDALDVVQLLQFGVRHNIQ